MKALVAGMSNLDRLQERLRTMDCQGILIPSTDEYLSEFAQPCTRRLRWATGFRGSTGHAIVLQDRAAIFLDGRYKRQGERDTAGLGLEVLSSGEAIRFRWLATHLRAGQSLAIDTRLQSYPEVELAVKFATEHGIKMIEVANNPIDELWGAERPPAPSSVVIDYPTHFAGAPAKEKCERLWEWLARAGMDYHLLADPEDVAWLMNARTHDSANATSDGWHIIPIPLTRMIVEATRNAFWFVERSRLEPNLVARLDDTVQIMDPAGFESFLEKRLDGKIVGANLRKTPHRFAAIAARVGTLRDDSTVVHRRWRKHPAEIERAREGHYRDGQAVIRFLAWLQRTVQERTVTELEAAQSLTAFRNELPGYKGISMPLMSASGASGAMAHYVPSNESNRRLNDHPIYWMDSGGQYYGCSTDNTVCIAVGKPEQRHIRAHTLVVKGFIALTLARFPAEVHSTQLDSFARQFLWQAGMDYGHGTGHGVGNFMNIHEGPSIRKEIDYPTVAPMEVGMIVSNEPAYYADGDFGIRVESHLVTVKSQYDGFLEFEVLSRLPIDPRLIDEALLTPAEKNWLADYHVRIADGYKGCFDEETTGWLQKIADSFVAMTHR
jgi:Xaa-Pro aminopeptidase